jgi:hypothetical protein
MSQEMISRIGIHRETSTDDAYNLLVTTCLPVFDTDPRTYPEQQVLPRRREESGECGHVAPGVRVILYLTSESQVCSCKATMFTYAINRRPCFRKNAGAGDSAVCRFGTRVRTVALPFSALLALTTHPNPWT